ncbi:hypothetical protein AB0E83_27755 [Streptomyces sp. NPDC035033]|uniref:hypothetical protein n=1 Tax=Streptomyces sp. NPDC035033 TaxID=3155368 RepID=UPI0033EC4958
MTVPSLDDPTYGADQAYETEPSEDFESAFFALELELLELPCVKDVAVLRTRLPEVGETLVVVYVPLAEDQEAGGRQAALAACERLMPWVPAQATAVDSVPRTADGTVRAGLLIDSLLPQIARDLLSPMEMSD